MTYNIWYLSLVLHFSLNLSIKCHGKTDKNKLLFILECINTTFNWYGQDLRFKMNTLVKQLGTCKKYYIIMAHLILESAQVPNGPFDLGLHWSRGTGFGTRAWQQVSLFVLTLEFRLKLGKSLKLYKQERV